MNKIIKIEKLKINEIPVLICYDNVLQKKIPIILLHQVLEDKEHMIMLAYYLAQNGYFVFAPDLLYHGESSESIRNNMKFNFNKLFTEMDRCMELIKNLLDYIKINNQFLLYNERAGVIGSSYGGMLALAAGSLYTDIKFTAALCTSANWKELVDNQSFESFRLFSEQRPVVDTKLVTEHILRYDPIYHVEGYGDKPVLLMNGAMDTTFKFNLVQPFYNKMIRHYEEIHCLNRFEWKKYLRAGHKVNYEMIKDLLEWLNKLWRK